jgi:hypothetical protein
MSEEGILEPGGGPEEQAGQPSMILLSRLLFVFVDPARVMRELAARPRWLGALLASAALGALALSLLPVELLLEANRQEALARGIEMPEISDRALTVMRVSMPIVAAVSTTLFVTVFALLYAVVFAFVLGDEGAYKHHLAVVAHAWFIPLAISLLLVPVRIAIGDLRFTLNAGAFFPFLGEGYFYNVLRALDLTQIWATLVIAQGVHAIDPRRSFRSAATVLTVFLLLWTLVIARFI